MTKIRIGSGDVDLDYPVCRPSLDLDFTQEELDPRITFTRGSTGTRVNRNRLIETVDANQPRFDYDPVTGECKGLLIEESRSNLVTYSEDISNSYWAKNNITVQSNATTAPDGTNTADKIVGNSNVKTRQSTYTQFVSVTSGVTYTFSVFLKAAERRYATIWFDNLNVSEGAYYGANTYIDLQTGRIVNNNSQTKIISYPNEWYRICVTATPTVTSTTFIFQIAIGIPNNFSDTGASNIYKYTGDGTSGLYVWGAQVEAGAFPTSYIPTTASTVTRSADVATMTGTNFSSWYNQNEGSIYLSAIPYYSSAVSGFNRLISINDGSSGGQTNTIQVITFNTINEILGAVWSSSVNQFGISKTITTGTRFKVALAIASNNCAGSFDGVVSGRDVSVIVPNMNQMSIGSYNNTQSYMTMHLSRLTYYPRRLKNNQLQYLTQ